MSADVTAITWNMGCGPASMYHARAWSYLLHELCPEIALAQENEELGVDVHDLEEVVRGFLFYGTEETGLIRNIRSKRIADGHIRSDRWPIDLYIWLDHREGHVVTIAAPPGGDANADEENVFFRVTSEQGRLVAERHFGLWLAALPIAASGST